MSILGRYFGLPYGVLQRQFEELLDEGLPLARWASLETAVPPANIYETAEEVVMEFEVPGVPRENIDLTTTDTSVTLKVTRRLEGDIPPEKYHVRERWRGELGRTLSVPSKVDSGAAKAEFANGVLTVRLPKKGRPGAKRIEVQAG
ncbi:MAG: Hsp20/alpha crystallin family protein [Planctomycetes bacterium]|nr:Hsp20/alpha crystallin family protein [Planctomycetota bacterium]